MSKHEARYCEQDGTIYALIVRIDRDGSEHVIHGYARYFKAMQAARKSTSAYIAGIGS